MLARPAANINVAEIIEAIDGPIAITACSGHHKAGCDRENHCVTRSGWRTINARIRTTLAGVSLAELQSERSFIHA
jgi:DNA-binding IscR family transcriptional regulator